MSRDGVPPSQADGRAPKVLVLVAEGGQSPTADALSAAGCAVEIVNRVAELPGRVARMAPDAVLLELSGDKETAGSEIHRKLATLTELDAALKEVERLRQAVAFARTTAHDLAQPLTTILARTQLLMNTIKPEDPHYRVVSIICAESERLANLTGEFSKLKEMAVVPASQKA